MKKMSVKWKTGLDGFWLLGASLIVFLAFLPALDNGFVQWDDNLFVFDNPNIKTININLILWCLRPFHGNWTPLPLLSHAIDYALFGLNPSGHHLTSILFHTANTYLVALVFLTLIRVAVPESDVSSKGKRFSFTAAVLGALFFGLSPLRVESVVWVSERRDVMFLFFGLLATRFYLSYVKERGQTRVKFWQSRGYLLSLSFFAGGLLSKSMLVTLPIVFLLIDYYPLNRFERAATIKEKWGLFSEKIPFLLLGGVVAMITLVFQDKTGASFSFAEIPLGARLGSAAYASIFYISKTLYPVDLAPVYLLDNMDSLLPLHHLLAIAIFLLISFVAIALRKRTRFFSIAWGFYIVTLLPVSGIFQVGNQFAADRYSYFPCLSIAMVFGVVSSTIIFNKLNKQTLIHRGRDFAVGCLAIYFLVIGMLLQGQIKVWRDTVSLWSQQLKFTEGIVSSSFYNRRGAAYFANGEYKQAIDDFSKSLYIDPNDPETYLYRAIVHIKRRDNRQAVNDLNVAA
ncbi:MAG: tetratricopeptide repeat protein, partial [Deltaproteobacteria bacterium]|nr:tetratricopeptide repeat protein [Deltaproteobacteria bacterium]